MPLNASGYCGLPWTWEDHTPDSTYCQGIVPHYAIRDLEAARLRATSIELHPWAWSELVKMKNPESALTFSPVAALDLVFGFPVVLNEDIPLTKARIVTEVDLPLMALPDRPGLSEDAP